MKKDAGRLQPVLVALIAGFLVLGTASGYLYRQNKTYQYQNHRLIILNDSILSENIELKNALQQKGPSAAFKAVQGNIKTKENK